MPLSLSLKRITLSHYASRFTVGINEDVVRLDVAVGVILGMDALKGLLQCPPSSQCVHLLNWIRQL